ncbi:hypothetical protein BVRB_2g029110 [Beta vulgaris subsp. vulgaris]|nr:hypothetical protein BVRB_2g029110 [Beta vulgaris subsp. vulgaris]
MEDLQIPIYLSVLALMLHTTYGLVGLDAHLPMLFFF